MADQIAAESGRSEEPQCYNCGGMGHWAVACPEPTRETPAGLAAWRNASATRQGSGRAQHNDGRRSKGPIITKYGPPPPPTGYGAHFPPPPGYPPPHISYTAPPPQPPSHPPHYPPQYHYLPGHGQLPPPPPPPPPPSHGQHHYPPPSYHPSSESYHGQQPRPPYPGPSPTYGAPHTAPHTTPHTASHTAPQTVSRTAPQIYGTYPYSAQDSQQFVPPRPAYSGSYAQGPGGGQTRHHQRPQPTHRDSAPSPPKSHIPQVASSPPRPPASSPPAPITHALPPKPPKSVHVIDHGRDQRNNKRKHDHQTRPRDINEHHPRRNNGSPKVTPVIHNSHNQSNASAQHHQGPQNRPGKQGSNKRRSSAGNHGSNQPRMQRQQSKDSPTPHAKGSQNSTQVNHEGRRINNNGEQHHGHHDQHKAADRPKQDYHAPKAAETSPILTQSVPSLPPKPSMVVEAYVPKLPDEHATTAPPDSPKLSERNVHGVDGNKERDRDDRSSTTRHGTKSDSSAQDDAERDDRPLKRFRRDSRGRSRSTSRHRDRDDLPALNRQRSRSLQRRYSPSRSPRSRNSSVSSRSSDLNSLEAELLGISARRPSTDSEQRRRPERVAPPKVKRRKPTNSAFSRRW